MNLPAYTSETAGHIEDISLGGLLLAHPHPLDEGQSVRLTFTLLDRELSCEGVVRRVTRGDEDVRLGIQIPQSGADFDADFERFAADHEPMEGKSPNEPSGGGPLTL